MNPSKPPMQPSILTQNMFFDSSNLTQQTNFDEYRLKRASNRVRHQQNNTSSTNSNKTTTTATQQQEQESLTVTTNPNNKQYHKHRISPLMNMVKSQTVEVRIDAGGLRVLDVGSDQGEEEDDQGGFDYTGIDRKQLDIKGGLDNGGLDNKGRLDRQGVSSERMVGVDKDALVGLRQKQNSQPRQQQKPQSQLDLQLIASSNPIIPSQPHRFQTQHSPLPPNPTNFCLSLDDSSDSQQSQPPSNQNTPHQTTTKPKQTNNSSAVFRKFLFSHQKQHQEGDSVDRQGRNDQGQQDTIQQQADDGGRNRKQQRTQRQQSEGNKRNTLLLRFDTDQQEDDEEQQQATMIDVNCNKENSRSNNNNNHHHHPQPSNTQRLAPTTYHPSQPPKNVFIKDFGQSSSSQEQQQPIKSSPHQPKTLLVHTQSSCSSISSRKSSKQQQPTLTRPISLFQLSRQCSSQSTEQSFIYDPIPLNCIFQTIIKRYPQPNENNHNVCYEMFDQETFKSVLKVRRVSEGFEVFWVTGDRGGKWDGNTKRIGDETSGTGSGSGKKIKKEIEEVSCALVVANFFGTQFNCFKFHRPTQKPIQPLLNRLLTIQYQTNIFGLNGPRKMQAFIPSTNYTVRGEKSLRQAYQAEKQRTINTSQQHQQPSPKIERFVNRTPRWNSEITSFVLNFNGRATVSSVKNFIITRAECCVNGTTNKHLKNPHRQANENLVVFGKMDKNVFNLDVKYPFSIVQGLALALSSFDKKIACE